MNGGGGDRFDFVVKDGTNLPLKAPVVDAEGEIVGRRQVRDPRLLGRADGYKYILETKGETPEPTFVSRMVQVAPDMVPEWPGSEVRTLVQQGDPKNRIDLTIVGDGYTAAEKDKFFADAKRITDDLFGDSTFASYLALFNVHAVFVPSNTSGIGDGRSKDTALGLYRHPQYRQAVMPGNEGAARKALKLAPDTDYPILLANDKHYGGLGGAFAITTSAPLNITTVLRHELGHNIGRVGEEYDGGQVYDGANFSSSSSRLPWAHFVKGTTPVHEAKLLHYSAPWKDLGKGTWEKGIEVPANADRVVLDFSSLGFDTKDDVQLLVDGKPMPFDGKFDYDRNFYRMVLPVAPGKHTLTFKEQVKDGNNIVSKVAVYALPKDYPTDRKLVGAYGTFNEGGRQVGFRPTDSDCLMRNMEVRHFCPACAENLWRNLLKEVSLIDGVGKDGDQVKARLLPLGDNRLRVSWTDPSGKERPDLAGKLAWAPTAADRGRWKLQVAFVSDEVKDPKHTDWSVHTANFELA